MGKNAVSDVNETKVDRVGLPVPSVGIFDAPYYGKKINVEWWQHISGMIAGLTELSAWDDTPANVKTAIDEISALLNREFEIMSCEAVNECLSTNEVLTQLVADSNRSINRAGNNQWVQKFSEYTNVYQSDVKKYLPDVPPKFLKETYTADESSMLCDVLGIWLEAWRIRALELIEILQGLVNFGSGISTAIGLLAGFHPDKVSSFILGTFSGFAGLEFRGTALELAELKEAYQSDTAIEDVKCALIQAFAFRSVGLQSYFRRMHLLDTFTTTADSTLIASHMDTVLADENIPENYQLAWLYLVELFDCVIDTNDPVGSCGTCIPALGCGVTPLRINVNTGSSSALPPPDYAGSDAIWAQSPVSVWYIGLRDNVNSWYEHRIGTTNTDEICFYRIAGIWRANSASITGAFLDVYADNALVGSFALPSPLNTTFQSFNFLLSETIICNSVRIKIRGGNSASNYTLLRNVEIWRYT